MDCPYCGAKQTIKETGEEVEEEDFLAALQEVEGREEHQERATFQCKGCGAQTTLGRNITAGACPFCGMDIVCEGGSRKQIKPRSLLPFKITAEEARSAFRRWIGGLWFAPNKLKEFARVLDRLQGLYIPFWTYDCKTRSRYSGERGVHYYVTEHYTDSQGKRQSRQVRKTRWSAVSGVVGNRFDDILILASHSLPRRYAEKLEPWDLKNLQPFQEEFLSGFQAESYRIGLEEGFGQAKTVMDEQIRAAICRDIGGDEQRIHSVHTSYSQATFKHILLPLWLSSFRFGERVYRFMVNARTGEVQGERPYSWVKIALAILVVLALLGGLVLIGSAS